MKFHSARPSLAAHGLFALLLTMGYSASDVYAQSTNIVATPPGVGGLGHIRQHLGPYDEHHRGDETGRRSESVS